MEKTACRTPTKGRDGVTNIPTWKYVAVRRGILDVLAQGDCPWGQLIDKVRAELTTDELDKMGSLGWHVTSVKLELEVRGEIERLDVKGPQILSKT